MSFFSKKPEIVTDEAMVDAALSRSVDSILPSKDSLKKWLLKGERLRFYIGADPTGPDLHIGHATNFILLEKIRQLGHEVIILFGDFTAMIGDPTDKDAARVRLSEKEVQDNIKTWEKQVGKVIDLNNASNPVRIEKNSEWLSRLTLKDLVELMSHMTVQQMIERDMFEMRLKEKKPIYLHEFLYPLMQGYDSVALDVDVEVGGRDQTFNMLVGRDLQKVYNNKEKFVIATTLLENPKTGKKLMSKSEGGYIGLSDTPEEMYGKTMALADETIIPMLTYGTMMPMEEIKAIGKSLESGGNPRDAKMRMARAVVKTYWGEPAMEDAEDAFQKAFQKKEIPNSIPGVSAQKGDMLKKILVDAGIVPSGAEFERLIAAGAVSNMETGEKISDARTAVSQRLVLKIGKKRFIRIEV